jgi:hypothetical protein
MSSVQLKDETHHDIHVLMQQSTHFQITDLETSLVYSAVNAQHGCQIMEMLTGQIVSKNMFYCLASKKGARAGALRRRFCIERT